MPPGVPVAGVGIENGRNVALLALRVIWISDTEVAEKLKKYAETQKNLVLDKDRDFQSSRLLIIANFGKTILLFNCPDLLSLKYYFIE